MYKFIGRKDELADLERLWEKTYKEGQLVIIYGKRRVGKTELVKEFIKDKKSAYYLASKTSALDQLRTASQTIFSGIGDTLGTNILFENWRNFFDVLGQRISENDQPKVIVVDEFPYLAQSDEAISSLFQYGWDERLKNTKTMLILMGSSINMMYKHTLSYNAPLYGRRTASFLIEPFSFNDSNEFLENADFKTKFSLYALVGGIPAYLNQLEPEKGLEYNLTEVILRKNSFLRTEPELLISEEFHEPRIYLTILKGIGMNQTKYSELLNVTNLDNNQLPFYLKSLLDLRLIKKEIPITEKNPETSKKGSYVIADNFLRFYFSFILPNVSIIESENLDKLIESKSLILQSLIAKAYENNSTEFVKRAIKSKQFPSFYQFGRWWNKNNEIDLLGLDDTTNSILFVETKWNNQKVDTRILKELQKKSIEVSWGTPNRKEFYCLISKSGFTDDLLEIANSDSNLILIEEDEVVK
jgi:uncharacterized protein